MTDQWTASLPPRRSTPLPSSDVLAAVQAARRRRATRPPARRIRPVTDSIAPPRAIGSRTTPWPIEPDPSVRPLPLPHGRSTGSCVFACPGGPSIEPGQTGRACFDLCSTGLGREVGRVVGVAVGGEVGRVVGVAVGLAVGVAVGVETGVALGVALGVWVGLGVFRGVGSEAGVVAGVPWGVGVGPCAISGGVADAAGLAVGEELGVASGVELDCGGVLTVVVGVGDCVSAGDAEGPTEIRGDAVAAATPDGGVVGATNPAVRATVARMRFSTPIATTRRARCAVVTVSRGLLDLVERVRSADRSMVASGPRRRRPRAGSRAFRSASQRRRGPSFVPRRTGPGDALEQHDLVHARLDLRVSDRRPQRGDGFGS